MEANEFMVITISGGKLNPSAYNVRQARFRGECDKPNGAVSSTVAFEAIVIS
jgi:hypothetical protein